MVYSFDVFDTCVTRMHAYPRDLFFELGLRFAPSNMSLEESNQFARRFQHARIRAERISNWFARVQHGVTNIHGIYIIFRWLARVGTDTGEVLRAELELEATSLYPVPYIVNQINALRTRGHRIVFISDMYIPKQTLSSILREHGIMESSDTLYVSCNLSLTKHSGALFSHILAKEKIDKNQIIHTGDSLHADIKMAEQHGIRTHHFKKAQLTKHESSIAGNKISQSPGRSLLAAFSRRTRLSMDVDTGVDGGHPLDDVICAVITPFLLSYVLWILNDAAKRNIKRLYFVARDGEILYEIARIVNQSDIELRYLYGSRRAWLAPSITLDTSEWMRLLVVPGSTNAPHDIVSRADLDIWTQAKLRERLGLNETQWTTGLTLDHAQQFVTDLLHSSKTATLVLAAIEEKRDIALKYFQQEGLLDSISWALVDSGWSLNSQSSLKRILASCNRSQMPQGYYLGLARDHLNEKKAGGAFSFTLNSESIFARRRVIVEHCFLPSTHASTCGYELQSSHLQPILSKEVRSETELTYARRLHEIVCHAARLVVENPGIRDALCKFSLDIKQIAAEFVRDPRLVDARFLSNFGVTADIQQERSFVVPLCRKLSLQDVWSTLVTSLSKPRSPQTPTYMWLEGSIALSSLFVRIPLKALLLMDSAQSHFFAKKRDVSRS